MASSSSTRPTRNKRVLTAWWLIHAPDMSRFCSWIYSIPSFPYGEWRAHVSSYIPYYYLFLLFSVVMMPSIRTLTGGPSTRHQFLLRVSPGAQMAAKSVVRFRPQLDWTVVSALAAPRSIEPCEGLGMTSSKRQLWRGHAREIYVVFITKWDNDTMRTWRGLNRNVYISPNIYAMKLPLAFSGTHLH